MNKKYINGALFTLCVLFLSVQAFAQQQLPCDIGPRTIRAYSLASSNSICLIWPENFFRQELLINRRIYTNRPTAWQNWTRIYSDTNPATAKGASQFCDTNVSSGIHYEYEIQAVVTNYPCSFRTDVGYRD